MAYDSAPATATTNKVPNTAFEATSLGASGAYFIDPPDYSPEEQERRQQELVEITADYNRRESPHRLLNQMTYSQNYRTNMLAANSDTPPRANAEDTQVVTGTTREKVLAIVAAVLQLNFETKFMAFDKDDMQDEELAMAMTDCVERANKMEQWDEKKIYAYFEMATQGDVYVEENFIDETLTDKKKIKISDLTEALMKDYKADYKTKTVQGMCQRNIIPGTQVYKGSMTERILRNQPHIWTREVRPYEVVKSIYGSLPRWKNVPRRLVTVGPGISADYATALNWRLETIDNEQCEILKRQDRFNDEYSLYINGVKMLPNGFPMPWEFQEYNLVQGSLEPISAFFSESKSIPCKTKLDQEILDEMYRLAVLKTQKSFMPPIANYSTNLLSRSMFLPGKVTNNLQKGEVEVLGGNPQMYAMQPSEFSMIQMIKKFIDEKSISPALEGNQQGGDQTATENNNIMMQAKQKLGLMIFGFINFHMQLDTIRLYNILENYTKPVDTKLNKLKDGVTNKYRSISVQKTIGDKGLGTRHVQFTTEHNSPSELWDMENGVTRDKNGTPTSNNPPKKPTQILQVNPEVLRSLKFTWFGQCDPSQRETTLSEKISFGDDLVQAVNLFGQQKVNLDYAAQKWAEQRKLDPNLFFNQNAPAGQQPQPGAPAPGQPGVPGQTPLQESNLKKQSRPFSSGAGPAEAMRVGKGGR
jgi:hypothetical protein